MKINKIETERKTTNEVISNPLSKTVGLSGVDKKAAKAFLDKFVTNLSTNINKGIKSGVINPKSAGGVTTASSSGTAASPAPAGTSPAPSGAATPTTPSGAATPAQIRQQKQAAATANIRKQMSEPAAPSGTPAPAAKPAGGPVPQGAAGIQNINNYVKNVSSALTKAASPAEKTALMKELVNFMADRKGQEEWDNSYGTVKAILSRNKAGGNMLRALSQGQVVAESWNVFVINYLLTQHDMSWGDLNLSYTKTKNNYIITENEYDFGKKYSQVLKEAAYSETISSYVVDYFKKYLGSAYNSKYEPTVNQLASQIEKDYASLNPMKRGGKDSIKKLGDIAYLMVKSSGGKEGTLTTSAAGAAPRGTVSAVSAPSSADKPSTQILKSIQALQKSSPDEFATLVKVLKPFLNKIPG